MVSSFAIGSLPKPMQSDVEAGTPTEVLDSRTPGQIKEPNPKP